MSVLEFIVQLTSALAWPLVAGGAVILLRKQIKTAADKLVERVGEIARVQFPGGSIDFKEVEALAATTEDLRDEMRTETIGPAPQSVLLPAETPDQRFEKYRYLAKVDPRAAVLLPFADLEAIIREQFQRRYPQERRPQAFLRILDTYVRDGLLNKSLYNTLRELASIRNRVAHENYSVDTETAELYIQSIEDVSTYVLLMPLFGEGPDSESS